MSLENFPTFPIILGSQSPRRKEIMDHFSLPFIQIASHFDEASFPYEGDPREYAIGLSREKARLLSLEHPDSIIITADTVVCLDDKLYGKPADEKEAFQYLSELSGKTHRVITAVTLKTSRSEHSEAEETCVQFNSLSESHIAQYIKNVEWHDKAGGYAIQNAGAILVQKIEGCYYNVMGLPINTLRQLLLYVNIDLWDYL